MRKRTIVLAALASTALALPAFALPPPPNTALTHGFDDENNVLVFGVSDVEDDNSTCDLESGSYGYVIDDEGNPTLTQPDGGGGAADGESEDDCELQIVDVTGPNGQVNHGQVVSSFVHALGELGIRGRGCIVRTIAQSGYGKGEQQVRTPDVTEGDTDALEGGAVDLETVLAACNAATGHDDDESMDSDAEKNGNGHGRPDSPGNSGKQGNGNGNGNGNGRGQGKP